MTGPAAPERQVTATGRGFAPVDESVGGSAADAGRNGFVGVSGLVVRYGYRVALDGVSSRCSAGSNHRVVGADGSGKSFAAQGPGWGGSARRGRGQAA